MTKQLQPGGSFAPPLSDELLDRYAVLASNAHGPIKDAMRQCLACVVKWWGLPESTGRGAIIHLDSEIAGVLDDHIPWGHEIDAINRLFDTIPNEQKELRNAAKHLVWHVIELDQGREPITSDKV